MQYQTEILRFKDGARSRHPAPDATIAAAQANGLEAGSQIAVIVDLAPSLPYRSRELRTLVVKAYWNSSGSIVARLRRALAAANRHLIAFNQQAPAGSKCSGNLTCAVFSEDELFLGQVGAAYAYVFHPPNLDEGYPGAGEFEIFPKRDRLLIPLGGSTPPIIHIGYTVMRPGSIACLATTEVAEAQAREAWEQVLAQPKTPLVTSQLSRDFSSRNVSGSLILIHAQASSPAKAAPWMPPRARRRLKTTAEAQTEPTPRLASLAPLPGSRHRPTSTASSTGATSNPTDSASSTPARGMIVGASDPSHVEPESQPAQPSAMAPARAQKQTKPSPASDSPVPQGTGRKAALARTPQPSTPRPPRRLSLPPLRQWAASAATRWQAWRAIRKQRTAERATTAERARLRQALRRLLPGKVETQRKPARRTPPAERPQVVGGLALGILMIVSLITVAERHYLGGAGRADELMVDARVRWVTALESQTRDDWRAVLDRASQVVRLDPENTEAEHMMVEAQQILKDQDNTSLVNFTQLLDLATAPVPRRLLVAGGWVYILNTATDTIIALPLEPDGLSLSTDSPTSILRRGQTYRDITVGSLVDFAWLTPNTYYPDGAVLIYTDEGDLFVYESTRGPGNVTVQQIEGGIGPGSVTVMKTFGQRFYLVNRQLNQILMYEPLNGIYRSPREYFAAGAVPDLYQIQDMAIDGRVYLLMGNGELRTYFAGTEDHSFNVRGVPQGVFEPRLITAEPDGESGYVYLADPAQERIVVLDKQGNFVHQYRFPKGEIKHVESLTVSYTPRRVLYLIADNSLYTAPLLFPRVGTTTTP
jgi:hypothetical protein